MESVPATGTVRRTVRVAAALIVGQALLCALLGYLTLGRSGAQPRGEPMAEPPFVPPATVTGGQAAPAGSPSATATRKARPRSGGTVPAGRSRKPAPPVPPAATAEPSPATPDDAGPPTGTTTGAPSSPLPFAPPRPPTVAPSELVQSPVTVDESCAPEGAFGLTAEGALVRCVRTGRHAPLWKIV